MSNKFYVTTPIFYPTGVPHIGTAYNVFIADTFARYYRSKLGKEQVFFLTGTDEHGANIARKAAEEAVEPQAYVDKYAAVYQETWAGLGISNDYFIRTTNPEHEKFAAELLQKSYDAGDIYPGEYSGLYCESCEAYYTEADLVDGKCPNHPTKTPVFTTEKNYYFRLSKYQDFLSDYLEQHPDFVLPHKWSTYVKSLINQGLNDIPVTRANVKWGIPVPFDKEQTIYVWYDALPNYLSTLHFPKLQEQGYNMDFWPVANHIVGKDIVKFHAILWPAMLKSAGYQLPQHVVVQGFFTVNGQKIGKSNNNAIDPLELAKQYPIDAIRFALLSEFAVGNDGDFSLDRLQSKYDNELGNNWGNLLNRVIHLAGKLGLADEVADSFKSEVDSYIEKYHQHMQKFEVFEAIQQIQALSQYGNVYIDREKPWLSEPKRAQQTLKNLTYLLEQVNSAYAPILPESGAKAAAALQAVEKVILFPKLEH